MSYLSPCWRPPQFWGSEKANWVHPLHRTSFPQSPHQQPATFWEQRPRGNRELREGLRPPTGADNTQTHTPVAQWAHSHSREEALHRGETLPVLLSQPVHSVPLLAAHKPFWLHVIPFSVWPSCRGTGDSDLPFLTSYNSLLLKAWSMDQHHLGTCWNCRVSGHPTCWVRTYFVTRYLGDIPSPHFVFIVVNYT